MRRRDFIAGLGGAAAWPLAARAQKSAMPVVGYINVAAREGGQERGEAAFRQGLRETGFIEGQNVVVEYRYADNRPDRLPEIVADLVKRNVAAIAASGGPATVNPVKAATSNIPIIFEVGSDPVPAGLVASLSRPGGNLTGVNSMIAELWQKHLDLIAKLLPNIRVFGLLATGGTPTQLEQLR